MAKEIEFIALPFPLPDASRAALARLGELACKARVAQSASLMHAAASYLRRAGPVIRAARLCVMNPAWAGISDEDVALEKALRDGGWL